MAAVPTGVHMRRVLAIAIVLAALTPAACDREKPLGAPSVPPPSIPATIAAVVDEKGVSACKQLDQASSPYNGGPRLDEQNVVLSIARTARQAKSPDIQAAGRTLEARWNDVVRAKGTAGDGPARRTMIAATANLHDACARAGIDR
jgi:hypothetical protein